MTYEQALQFWFGRINYEQRTLRPGDLKLDRMRSLLEEIGNPQDQIPIVHIAGSKGKGSTAAMLAEVLRQAGYRTGLFTSPHLCDVRERIQINGHLIEPDQLTRTMEHLSAVVERLDKRKDSPAAGVTFFEIATALAYLHFRSSQVEIAVMEVGLGGRFDATNVCRPLLSVITSISLDHTQQLGDTLAKITFEKAGIIKPERPVISGVRAPEAIAVIKEICAQRSSPLSQLGVTFHFDHEPGRLTRDSTRRPVVHVVTKQRRWPALSLKLVGEHQAANAAVVVAAVDELQAQGIRIGSEALALGLEQVHWPARLEVLRHRPQVILDCAHNVASAEALVDALNTSFPLTGSNGAGATPSGKPPQRYLLFAGSNDKDLAGMLRVLAPFFHHVVLTRYRHNPRHVPPQELASQLQSVSPVPFTISESAEAAWEALKAKAEPDDLICITGSVFLAGELRPIILNG